MEHNIIRADITSTYFQATVFNSVTAADRQGSNFDQSIFSWIFIFFLLDKTHFIYISEKSSKHINVLNYRSIVGQSDSFMFVVIVNF